MRFKTRRGLIALAVVLGLAIYLAIEQANDRRVNGMRPCEHVGQVYCFHDGTERGGDSYTVSHHGDKREITIGQAKWMTEEYERQVARANGS